MAKGYKICPICTSGLKMKFVHDTKYMTHMEEHENEEIMEELDNCDGGDPVLFNVCAKVKIEDYIYVPVVMRLRGG